MDTQTRNFQERVEQAAACKGDGTELVTVWIPAGKNLQSVKSRLQGEAAEAQNIKSKQTREHVLGALQQVINVLHKYDTTPENGIVVCGGYVNGEYVTFVFDDLPDAIRESKYECSDEFVLDGLWEMAFGGSEWWGLLVVTRDSASIGRYSNTEFEYVDVIDCFESQVMGKSKAGGQSAKRFERLRQEQAENHYKKAARIATENFDPTDEDFQGIALAGPNVSITDFLNWLPSRLQDEVVTRETIDHAGNREALVALAEAAESAFNEQEKQRERELVERFKSRLRDDNAVAYGKDEVSTALEYGAVDTLLLSADLAAGYINERSEAVRNQGGEVTLISTVHEQGQQLEQFGGEAALLRFDIN